MSTTIKSLIFFVNLTLIKREINDLTVKIVKLTMKKKSLIFFSINDFWAHFKETIVKKALKKRKINDNFQMKLKTFR
jgi:hypothetical protein